MLVDEVYLDAVYENTPRTSFHLGPEFVVTSSLTKMYGVSGLRCGWILAQPDLARAMWRMNDVMAATPVHPGELLSVAVFRNLDRVRDRFRRIVKADREAAQRLPGSHAAGERGAHRVGHHLLPAPRQRETPTASWSACAPSTRPPPSLAASSACPSASASAWE